MLELTSNAAEANVSTEACSKHSALLVEPNNFTFLAACVSLSNWYPQSQRYILSDNAIPVLRAPQQGQNFVEGDHLEISKDLSDFCNSTSFAFTLPK